MTVKGKHVIVVIFVLAFVLAAGNLLYQWKSGRRAKEYWSAEHGKRIADSEEAELWLLRQLTQQELDKVWGPEGTLVRPEKRKEGGSFEGPITNVGEVQYCIPQRKNVLAAPGITHVRKALLQDRLYDWETPPPKGPTTWRYALRFSDHEDNVTLYLDEPCLLVYRHGQEHPLRIKPQDGKSPLVDFIREQFEER